MLPSADGDRSQHRKCAGGVGLAGLFLSWQMIRINAPELNPIARCAGIQRAYKSR